MRAELLVGVALTSAMVRSPPPTLRHEPNGAGASRCLRRALEVDGAGLDGARWA